MLTSQEAQEKLNISRQTLSRWVTQGKIIHLSYDLYIHVNHQIPHEILSFTIACKKFGPSSAIGTLSALFHYRLIDDPPSQVWVITPPQKTNHNPAYNILRTKISLEYGINSFELYKITNIERTLIETLHFSSRIGEKTALHAARRALQNTLTTEKKLAEMATKLKLENVLKKH